MSGFFEEIGLKDLFSPVAGNVVFKWAKEAGCHASCIVPVAVLKAAEVEMGMALPRRAGIVFE